MILWRFPCYIAGMVACMVLIGCTSPKSRPDIGSQDSCATISGQRIRDYLAASRRFSTEPELLAQAYDSCTNDQDRCILEEAVLHSEAWTRSSRAKEELLSMQQSFLNEVEQRLRDRKLWVRVENQVVPICPNHKGMIALLRRVSEDDGASEDSRASAIRSLALSKDLVSIPKIAQLAIEHPSRHATLQPDAIDFLKATTAREALLEVMKAFGVDCKGFRRHVLGKLTIAVGEVCPMDVQDFLCKQAENAKPEWVRFEAAASLFRLGHREYSKMIEKGAETCSEACLPCLFEVFPLMDFSQRDHLIEVVRTRGIANKENYVWYSAVRCLVRMKAISLEEASSLALTSEDTDRPWFLATDEAIQGVIVPTELLYARMQKLLETCYQRGTANVVSSVVAKWGGETGVALLLEEAVGGADWKAVVAAAALLELGRDDTKSVVLRGMQSGDVICREICCGALAKTGQTADMGALRKALETEKDVSVRNYLVAGFLRLMTPYAEEKH